MCVCVRDKERQSVKCKYGCVFRVCVCDDERMKDSIEKATSPKSTISRNSDSSNSIYSDSIYSNLDATSRDTGLYVELVDPHFTYTENPRENGSENRFLSRG